MSLALGVPYLDHSASRPPLQRSRSHTTPSQPGVSAEQSGSQTTTGTPSTKRPPHVRSQSHLSPVDTRPRNAVTLPSEPAAALGKEKDKHSHRLHLPGSSRHHREHDQHWHHRRHRHTQSEALHYPGRVVKKATDSSASGTPNPSFPNLVAGITAERDKVHRTHASTATHNLNNDLLSAVPGSLTRMISTRSYRGNTTYTQAGAGDSNAHHSDTGGRFDLRRRATSDPRAPGSSAVPQRIKSPIELDLERADRVRRARRLNITKETVEQRDREIGDAEEEMRARIADISRSAMEITRRLDYGYYNLLEKVGNLVGTIQSFGSLANQSRRLSENFEHETANVDSDVQRRIKVFKKGFERREDRAKDLTERGKWAREKAEELGRRLDNAKIMVQNWEKREYQSKKVWGRFWGGVGWTTVMILVLIVALVVGKEWWFSGDPVKAGFGVPAVGNRNESLALGGGGVGDRRFAATAAEMPDDVRTVLEGIEERNRRGKNLFKQNVDVETNIRGGVEEDDARMRILDEL